jgi:hypothetical protein
VNTQPINAAMTSLRRKGFRIARIDQALWDILPPRKWVSSREVGAMLGVLPETARRKLELLKLSGRARYRRGYGWMRVGR